MKANFTINNEELEQVEEFKYIGQTITADAKTEKEIRIRTGIAKSRFQEIKTILMNRRISQDLKLDSSNVSYIQYLHMAVRPGR